MTFTGALRTELSNVTGRSIAWMAAGLPDGEIGFRDAVSHHRRTETLNRKNMTNLKTLLHFSIVAFAISSCLVIPSHGQEPTKEDLDSRNLVAAALRFYDLKQYDQSIQVAMNAAKLRPNDHRPWAIIGNCYLAQWKMKSASEAYAKAAEINPKLRGLWYLKAYSDRRRNAREESIAAAKKAIEIDPKYAEAYQVMGEALAMGSKDTEGAIEAFRMALKLKPEYVEASEQLGMQLSVKGNNKEAEEVFGKCLDLDPKKMSCRFSLGRILVKEGRLVEAREIWNARTWDEKDTFPLFITVLERAERKKAAEDRLAASPGDPVALTEMGFAVLDGESWSWDGRQQKALEYFKKASSLKGNYVRAQYGICKAYVELAARDPKLKAEVERELDKLKKMDKKLAAEIEEYRKNFSGVIRGEFRTLDQ